MMTEARNRVEKGVSKRWTRREWFLIEYDVDEEQTHEISISLCSNKQWNEMDDDV